MIYWLIATALAQAPSEPTAEPAAWQRDGFGWGALPALNYNSDEGFGFGAIANLYKYDGQTSPYRWNLGALFFLTTKGIHNHRVEIDALRVGGSPLRLTARVNLEVTRAGNFCGFGHRVTCDPAEAESAADDLGLTSEEREVFISRYYRVRYVRPNAFITARYAIDPMPHRVELFGGWRVEGQQPGDFTANSPFPGSRYAELFPDGERGLLSVLQAGIMVDNRDAEAAPKTGYWVEASLRGASQYWGSDWGYVGFNTTLRGYLPLTTDKRLVSATRFVFDGFAGDAPTREWANPGGATLYSTYGSLNSGRGIRARRYLGRVKTVIQEEARWTAVSGHIGGVPVDLTLLAFADVGFIAAEWSELDDAFAKPLLGTGGGVRIAIDTNFIVRTDVAVSRPEGWAPFVYIDLANLY